MKKTPEDRLMDEAQAGSASAADAIEREEGRVIRTKGGLVIKGTRIFD